MQKVGEEKSWQLWLEKKQSDVWNMNTLALYILIVFKGIYTLILFSNNHGNNVQIEQTEIS